MMLSKIRQPQLVAITGGSGGGKSWLADRLQSHLGPETVARVSLDEFYRDRSHVPRVRRSALNFDHPRAIDWKWVERVLADFTQGNPAPLPCYDFVEHVRACAVRWLEPRPVLIMDGLWLLRRPAIRKFFQHRVFLDCPAEIRLQRRLSRDVAERGRDPALVQLQFENSVAPMHERFVAGQRRWANVILAHPIAETGVEELAADLCRAFEAAQFTSTNPPRPRPRSGSRFNGRFEDQDAVRVRGALRKARNVVPVPEGQNAFENENQHE